jgi:gamma-glutamyl:cysteine ligase YbdK (ATP-grasp superfamily)
MLSHEAQELGLEAQLSEIAQIVTDENSDADWIREQFEKTENLSSVVQRSCEVWMKPVTR